MTKHRSIYRTILLSALVTCTANRDAAAATPPAYHVTDLGPPGAFFSVGLGINEIGQVTGRSDTTGDNAYHAFLWTPTSPNSTNGTMTDLGTPIENYSYSSGEGINDSGQVIGFFGPVGLYSESFLWTPTSPNGNSGTMQGLGTLGGTSSYGFGINDSGQVTGGFYTPGVATHAFVYDGTMHDLGTLGGTYSSGYRINDGGQVIGTSQTTGNVAEHPFLWTPTTPNGVSGAMIDLGSFGGTLSGASGINDSGQVVGHSYLPGDAAYHAFLYDGAMHDLGTLGGTFSSGEGINDSGQVVGWSYTATARHAFLYTSDSGMVDLNSLIDPLSGWELYGATGINDAGQITGFGSIGGESHAFLLTPVPEPASLALIALGAAAIAIRRIRRIISFLCLFCALSLTTAAHAASYTVTDLGTLGGTDSLGWGINASGQVTGYATTTDDENVDAFLWNPTTPNAASGTMHDLGTLGGSFAWGIGINAQGHVAGISATTGDAAEHATLWIPTTPNGSTGTLHDLGTLGGTHSQGTGINDSGQVTGYSDMSGDSTSRAFMWKPTSPGSASGTMHDLGSLGGSISFGWDINASGQVTGNSDTTGDAATHAFLWNPATPNGFTGTMHDLGTLGGTWSDGGGINDSGQVAGSSLIEGDEFDHAFLWTPTTPGGTSGTMLDLGTLGGSDSYGYNLNAAGQVVGLSYVPAELSNYSHAFLYTSGVGMVDLNNLIDPLSGWELLDASAINNAGQITGQGLIGGEYHAYLLTPIPIPGDFNHDGSVEASDYVVWRKGLGTTYTHNDYNVWRAHFGQTAATGASAESSSSAVPEPSTLALLLFAATGSCARLRCTACASQESDCV